jgi:hypothetical protein
MSPAGFEPWNLEGEQLQTYALDRGDRLFLTLQKFIPTKYTLLGSNA